MRISSINVAQPRNVNYNLKTRQTMPQRNYSMQTAEVPFKGLKAGLFGLIGAGAGVALGTVLSGGLLAPILLANAGAYVGCVAGSENEETDQYGR